MSNTDGKFVTHITEKECMEFFTEGLLQAASAARRLAQLQSHPIWHDISLLCDEMRNNGIQLSLAKSINRQDTLQILKRREDRLNQRTEDSRPQTPKIFLN